MYISIKSADSIEPVRTQEIISLGAFLLGNHQRTNYSQPSNDRVNFNKNKNKQKTTSSEHWT